MRIAVCLLHENEPWAHFLPNERSKFNFDAG
jgi:hypothetical protein